MSDTMLGTYDEDGAYGIEGHRRGSFRLGHAAEVWCDCRDFRTEVNGESGDDCGREVDKAFEAHLAAVKIAAAPDAPSTAATFAEPTQESVITTGVDDIALGTCAHCGEPIWKGAGWDWEHTDSDAKQCA